VKVLRKRFFSVSVILLLFFSSCSEALFSEQISRFYNVLKSVVRSPLSLFKGRPKPTSSISKTTLFFGGGGALLALVGLVGYYLGYRNSGDADDQNGVSSSNPSRRPTTPKKPLNWADANVRVEELKKYIRSKSLGVGVRKIVVGEIENYVYQIKSSGQSGAQCGPSALFNAFKLSNYFDSKKGHDKSIAAIKNLNNGTTRRQVRRLSASGTNVEWLLFDELTGILQSKRVPGLELNKNVFVFPSLSFYSRSRSTINDLAKPLYDMNLKEKGDGFSCSFIIPSFRSESSLRDDGGHWICVHVVKTGDTYNWFVACSMNYKILRGGWWEKIKFMIYMLLDEDPSLLCFGSIVLYAKVKARITHLKDIPELITAGTTRKDLKFSEMI